MNQILYTAESKSHGPLPIKTILRFFAFSLIILGIIFIGENVYSLISNSHKLEVPKDYVPPKIEFAQDR